MKDAGRGLAEGDAGFLLDAGGVEDRAGFVEGMEAGGGLIEIGCQQVGAVVDEDGGDGLGELGEFENEGSFLRRAEFERASEGDGRIAEFAEDGAGADVGVLQIRRGVAVEAEHFLPREFVIGEAVLAEFGVFHGADADSVGDGGFIRIGQRGIFFLDDGERTFGAFLQDFAQTDALARSGFEHFAIGSEDAAEGDVDEFLRESPEFGCSEELLEMVGLGGADDVPDFIGMPDVDAVLDGGEVGGSVEVAAIAFLDEHGLVLQRGDVWKENALGAIALTGDATGLEFVDEAGESGVVEAFTEVVIEMDVELVVDVLQTLERHFHTALPDGEVFGVALLEFDEFGFAGFAQYGIGFLGGVYLLIEA